MNKMYLFLSLLMTFSLNNCTASDANSLKDTDWEMLRQAVEGRLVKPEPIMGSCIKDPKSSNCQHLKEDVTDPFYLQEFPGATQTSGYLGGWTTALSNYAVACEKVQDVVEAVKFAKKHNIRLVIKGAGHDYLGRSCEENSLLIWTHNMRKVTTHENFIPQGSPTKEGFYAVTAESGTRWIEAYTEVTTKGKRYVQGGGCTSVGVAGGFLQGGGFGSLSKKFGSAAGNLLEAEVVTAKGEILVANEYQNSDLFWALRGGGGSTFAVVTKVTLKTHELPEKFGLVLGTVTSKNDSDFQELIKYMIDFHYENLGNGTWGEHYSMQPDNSIQFTLVFQGIDKEKANNTLKPFKEWLSKRDEKVNFELVDFPAYEFWNYEFMSKLQPDAVSRDKETPPNFYWWSGDSKSILAYLFGYGSRWIPKVQFDPDHSKDLAKTVFDATRHAKIQFFLSKGLAGASDEIIKQEREQTSYHPIALDSLVLAIVSGGKPQVLPGVSDMKVIDREGKEIGKGVIKALEILENATPNSGTYYSQSGYDLKNWQSACWGKNYPRLLEIKKKYDPDNLFHCHHSVGSEGL